MIKTVLKQYQQYKNMSIQGLQISKEQIRYVFPKQIKHIIEFVRVYDLKKKLKQYFQEFSCVLPNFPYRSRYPSSGNTIVFQCQFCANKLVYEVNRQKGKYQLKSFSVDHIHGINFDNQQIKKNDPIEQYPINTQGISQIIREKAQKLCEPLSNHVQNMKKQKMREPENFDQLLKILQQQNYYVSYEPENFKDQQLLYPDFLFISSPEMKKTYQTYGRCIGFDFTYSLIKQTPLTKYGKRQYMIGLIAGLNSYRRIGIYALVVANEESGHFVEKAFTEFMNYMGRQPQSIVTDQSLGMLAGTKRIKEKGVYNGNTYWDTFHVLKTYKFRHRELKSHMRRMIRVKCKYQFHKMYLQAVLLARTQDQMDAIHKFMHESNKYCISQIEPDFIGLGVSDSQNQMVNNLIKNQIPHQSKYIKVVHRILSFIDQRNLLTQMLARETCRIDQVVNCRELHIVRYSLCRTVYSFLFIQICKCCKVDLIYQDTEDNDFYCVQDANTVHYITRIPINECKITYRTKAQHIKEVFKCSCQFQEKTGIPCQHILKVIFETDNNFIDRIDQYWVVEDPDKLFKCITAYDVSGKSRIKKRGRPLGKPTLYFDPQAKVKANQLKLPQGISTFEPIKPRGQNQAFPDNNKQMKLYQPEDEQQQYENSVNFDDLKVKKTSESKRIQKIKNFYAKNL